MRRRRFAGLTAGLFGAAGLAATGCGSPSAGNRQILLRILVTEYGDDSDTGSTERFWNELATRFRMEHPEIAVDVSAFTPEEATREVARRVEAGTPPDIAQISAFADLAEAGRLYSADEILTIPALADFIPSIASAGEVRRIQYGMPFAARVGRFFYNMDLFEQAGLDPDDPPETWDQLLAAARALHMSGVPTPLSLPFGHSEAHAEAAMWMLSGDGALTDSGGSYVIDSPANARTFTWLRDEIVGTGLAGLDDPSRTSRFQTFTEFSRGEAGMVFGDPTLMRQADLGGIRYRTTQLPGRSGVCPSTLGSASWVLAFNQQPENREAIGVFLNYMFTTGNVGTFAERYELLPVTTPAAERMGERRTDEERRLAPFLEDLPTATFFPVGKVSWTRVSAALAQEIGRALRPGGNVRRILGSLQIRAQAADDLARRRLLQ